MSRSSWGRTRGMDFQRIPISRIEEACGWLGRNGDPGQDPPGFSEEPEELREMDERERRAA